MSSGSHPYFQWIRSVIWDTAALTGDYNKINTKYLFLQQERTNAQKESSLVTKECLNWIFDFEANTFLGSPNAQLSTKNEIKRTLLAGS